MDEHYLDYTEEHERFARHIEPEDNRHIFFSGKYGVGKSTFIRKFFEKHKDEYYSVFLTPVDYVVSSNENIFELIKADIIRHFFADGKLKQVSKTNTQKGKAIAKATIKNLPKLVPSLIGSIDKLHAINPYVINGVTVASELFEQIKQIHSDALKNLEDAADKLDTYQKDFGEKLGTHLESNIISELIKSIIDNIRATEKSKEKVNKRIVLIIDDLDRLDPEHVFRILNILSAHSKNDGGNKFGFDKLVLIGDYDNIENIYHHRYGANADFRGYIDKYYSREVFLFDFRPVFLKFIEQKIGSKLPYYAKQFLDWLVNSLVNRNEIRFRDIIRSLNDRPFSNKRLILSTTFPLHEAFLINFKDINNQTIHIYSENLPMLYIIELLSIAFGGIDKLTNALSNIIESKTNPLEIDENTAFIYYKTAATSIKFINTTRNQHLFLGKRYKENSSLLISEDFSPLKKFSVRVIWEFENNEYSSNSCYYSHSSIEVKPNDTYTNNALFDRDILNGLLKIITGLKPTLTKFGIG